MKPVQLVHMRHMYIKAKLVILTFPKGHGSLCSVNKGKILTAENFRRNKITHSEVDPSIFLPYDGLS